MPAILSKQGFVLRSETEADIPFLRRLYVSTRWEELAPVPWTDAQKIAFLEQQFAAQRHHYLGYYPDTAFDVLEATAGVQAGRLYLDRQSEIYLIVDISLMPEWRRRGIGTALIEAVFAEAHGAGKAVEIAVEKFNPAQRLYRRLGFREYLDDGPYLFMRWPPKSGAVEIS